LARTGLNQYSTKFAIHSRFGATRNILPFSGQGTEFAVRVQMWTLMVNIFFLKFQSKQKVLLIVNLHSYYYSIIAIKSH
jgi:hypothetical protein